MRASTASKALDVARRDPRAVDVLEQAAHLWRAKRLLHKTRLELSTRLRSSLGISYPERLLIRLNPQLLEEQRPLLAEVLCHEFAHIVAHARIGTAEPPHGPTWRSLMAQAGLPARVRAGVHTPATSSPRAQYRHLCQTCGAQRISRRRMQRWRCQPCSELGLEGSLTISELA